MPGLLHVCTGNLCRSPMAEVLTRAGLRARFGPGPDLVPISSAGTDATDGRDIWPLADAELARRGQMVSGFTSRRLTPAMIGDADLVLTGTVAHREAVVAMDPGAAARSFTWRELSALLAGVRSDAVPGAAAADRLRALTAMAAARRDADAPEGDLDVPDPMGRDAAHFTATADVLVTALRPVVDLL